MATFQKIWLGSALFHVFQSNVWHHPAIVRSTEVCDLWVISPARRISFCTATFGERLVVSGLEEGSPFLSGQGDRWLLITLSVDIFRQGWNAGTFRSWRAKEIMLMAWLLRVHSSHQVRPGAGLKCRETLSPVGALGFCITSPDYWWKSSNYAGKLLNFLERLLRLLLLSALLHVWSTPCWRMGKVPRRWTR